MNVMIRDITGGGNQEELIDELARMRKDLCFLLENLDHLNVKRLYTEYCDIRSKDGETIIDGPTLHMYDKQATPVLRLQMGYDPDTALDFVFAMFNKSGVKTVGIDSNGDATFTGTITGGTIQTAVADNDRIVITGNSLRTYNSSNNFNGPVWGVGYGGAYGDLSFYDDGTETFRIENSIGIGWTLRPMNGGALYVGYGGSNTYASGNWSFATAGSVSGLVTDTAPNHNHGITPGTMLAIEGGGSVEWVASGSHYHDVE